IDSHSGVTHHRDVLTAMDNVARADVDLAEVSVQTVIRRTSPVVLDHDVSPVVRMTGHQTRVDNFAVGDRAHLVERLAALIAVDRANVDPFVKTRVNNPGTR